jgi:predicted dehydrogenase
MGTGVLAVHDLPAPVVQPGCLLVANASSLISPGTERATTATAEKSLIGKAKARPDLVRQVVQSAVREGLGPTISKVRDRLDQLKPLGYSSAGVVLEVGSGCIGFAPGDRVACAGGGYAVHAEVVNVPKNLCALVPDTVDLSQASFTTLGAIATHGIRQADVTFGETVGVIGLGLVGQLCMQILKAAGCRVLGIDLEPGRCDLALTLGADVVCGPTEAAAMAQSLMRETGLDAVLVTASTSGNEPVAIAAELLRDRGRVVVVGAVGMGLEREPFYSKEIDLRMSRSYGPGRYDPAYEEGGQEYPIGYVRWTEQRNMAAFIELIRSGKVNVERLTTHRYPIERAVDAYDLIKAGRGSLGVLIEYANHPLDRRVEITPSETPRPADALRVSFVGAGNFAQTYLLPHVKANKRVSLSCVVTRAGGNAKKLAEKHGFSACSTDIADVTDDSTNAIFVATRHNTHGSITIQALRAGKHVFVEKPLSLNLEDLLEVEEAYADGSTLLQVGFNRRFAPLTAWARDVLSSREGAASLIYRINAGQIPSSHWVHDPVEGGGRILGEVCHFVDFAQHILGGRFRSVFAQHLRGGDPALERENVHIQLLCENGSAATIVYSANGDAAMEKERIEILKGGLSIVIEDFRRGWSFWENRRRKASARPGKGHSQEVVAFLEAITSGSPAPIPFDEIIHTTRATFAILESLNKGLPIDPADLGG